MYHPPSGMGTTYDGAGPWCSRGALHEQGMRLVTALCSLLRWRSGGHVLAIRVTGWSRRSAVPTYGGNELARRHRQCMGTTYDGAGPWCSRDPSVAAQRKKKSGLHPPAMHAAPQYNHKSIYCRGCQYVVVTPIKLMRERGGNASAESVSSGSKLIFAFALA
jgi:hypothetical protein